MDGSNGFNPNNNQEPKPFIPPYENNANNQGYNNQGYNGQYNSNGYTNNQSGYQNYSQQPYNNYQGYGTPGNQPGKSTATAGLVLGILSIVFWFFGLGAVIGLILGIIGVICSANAKKEGYTGSEQVGGMVCSIIGIIGGGIVFVSCLVCVGTLSALESWY